ncbi:hypothetical protein JCM10207_006994 [Rhodosporidiobolus poonsookiae]
MTSLAAPEPAPTPSLTALHAVLPQLDTVRLSLPSLLRALSAPSASSSADPDARAHAYRTAVHHCTASIAALAAALDKASPALAEAEDSERRDGQAGVVLRPRKRAAGPPAGRETAGGPALGERLAAVLGDGSSTSARDRRPKWTRRFPPSPADRRALEALVNSVAGAGRKGTRAELYPTAGEGQGEVREVRVEVSGVMRARVGIRWSEDSAGRRSAGAEVVVCHGLREDKPPHVPSQYALFRGLTDEAMGIIDQARARRARNGGEDDSVEEVLAFLVDPPLPF